MVNRLARGNRKGSAPPPGEMTSSNATSIQLGSYQLGARLGEGGSSEVFRATGPDGREVAVKLLGPHAELDDERARSRFRREIELVGELDHPHLVQAARLR